MVNSEFVQKCLWCDNTKLLFSGDLYIQPLFLTEPKWVVAWNISDIPGRWKGLNAWGAQYIILRGMLPDQVLSAFPKQWRI